MSREKTIQKKFFVDENENEDIKIKMREAKLDNFSVYARMMLTTGKITVIDFETLKNLRYEINKIGININQLVKLAHENQRVTERDIEQLLNYYKDLNRKVSMLIDEKLSEVDE